MGLVISCNFVDIEYESDFQITLSRSFVKKITVEVVKRAIFKYLAYYNYDKYDKIHENRLFCNFNCKFLKIVK